jgi:sporulation protein YlmC with PRC-barrel domain
VPSVIHGIRINVNTAALENDCGRCGCVWNRGEFRPFPSVSQNTETKMPTASGHTVAIRASRVIGTPVKDQMGDTIGKIEDVVLDKIDNEIMFGVVGFGGFLGLGEKFHPVPWSVLDYSEDAQAYVVPYTREQLEAAPNDTITELTREDGAYYRDRAYDYYKVEPYWH